MGVPDGRQREHLLVRASRLLLAVGLGAAAVSSFRRRTLPPLALVLAGAPLAWFVLLALTLAYDEWQGRFFVYPVALSASLWGLVLPVRRYAVPVVALTLTTAALSLVHLREKPSVYISSSRRCPPPSGDSSGGRPSR